MKNVNAIYNSIINGETALETLESSEIALLFGYLCECLENGDEVNRELLDACAEMLDVPQEPEPDTIISNTYKRLNFKAGRSKLYSRSVVRRLLIASLAVLTFIISTFITASALGVDIVESVKMILTDKKGSYIIYENHSNLYISGNPEIKLYSNMSELFEAELSEYIYPTHFPSGAQPHSVKLMHESADDIFQIQIRTDGENWVILASDAENSYLPSGYKYTAESGEEKLEFVYTMSRKGTEVTKYDVYTVYNGVQYTFHLHTGKWEDVEAVIKSIVLP